MLKNVFAPEMLPIREVQLMRALSSCAGVYYDINVSKNAIIGTPVQVIDDVEYSVLEAAGLSRDCLYTEFIEYWGQQLEPEEQEDFKEFFSVKNLLKCYGEGKRSLVYTYWTQDVLGNPMLAEQSILLYEDTIYCSRYNAWQCEGLLQVLARMIPPIFLFIVTQMRQKYKYELWRSGNNIICFVKKAVIQNFMTSTIILAPNRKLF